VKWKAEQEKQRRDQTIANATGLRVLSAIAAAVPVRLLKRDLIFVLEKLVSILDESRIETLARQHGIRKKRDDGGIKKTVTAFVRRPMKVHSPGCWSSRASCWRHHVGIRAPFSKRLRPSIR
jgi:hypothetical protein